MIYLFRKVAHLPQQTPCAAACLRASSWRSDVIPGMGCSAASAPTTREGSRKRCTARRGVYQDRAVDTLSGGERQGVWLAMLVAQNLAASSSTVNAVFPADWPSETGRSETVTFVQNAPISLKT